VAAAVGRPWVAAGGSCRIAWVGVGVGEERGAGIPGELVVGCGGTVV